MTYFCYIAWMEESVLMFLGMWLTFSVIRQKGLRFVEVHLIGMIASYYGLNILASLMNVTLGSMIGSLMYLTASRLDIMFVVYACDRFQVTPKVSHLHAMKRIFRYLKGQPKLGLWYSRDSSFDLEAFLDSDYTRASLDRKSTTGSCQFLGKRLISWKCKKQTVVSNLTTKAEYVAAANCYRQVLWIQNRMLDYALFLLLVDDEIQVSTVGLTYYINIDDGNAFWNGIEVKNGTSKVNTAREQTPLFPCMLAIQAEEGKGGSPRCQEAMGGSIAQTRSERVPTQSYDSPLLRVHTLGSDEGSMTLQELTVLCTTLSKKVESLEADLKQTKKVYGAAYTKLIKKVKKLEKTVKSNQARRRAKIVVSDDEEDLEDSSKKGRMIEELIKMQKLLCAAKVLADAAKENVHTYTRRRRAVSTGSGGISTASRLFSNVKESISTASASMTVSTAGMFQEVNISISSLVVIKDKSKGKMEESEDEHIKRTKLQQEQDRLGHEAALRLQEELDEEERQRMAKVHEAA
ncbi:hypothetical protein Tco_1054403 [Tanacetum coccineum]|uniref:Uncharacterized protein n=1 Tax=Tanacetum coccineum TaxID=301880 RepID=A0ABQ5GWN8_9ASTR